MKQENMWKQHKNEVPDQSDLTLSAHRFCSNQNIALCLHRRFRLEKTTVMSMMVIGDKEEEEEEEAAANVRKH